MLLGLVIALGSTAALLLAAWAGGRWLAGPDDRQL